MRARWNLLPVALLAGCSGEDTSVPRPGPAASTVRPQIAAGSEDGFVDLSFAIASRTREPAAGERIVAIGQDGGRDVGFAVLLEPGWTSAKLEGAGLTTYRGSVAIESLGPQSDHLLQAMDRLYSTGSGVKAMAPATRFAAIALGGNPSDLDAGPARIKLFFESEIADRYAELFLHIDIGAGKAGLDEKDPEYRSAVVRALSGH